MWTAPIWSRRPAGLPGKNMRLSFTAPGVIWRSASSRPSAPGCHQPWATSMPIPARCSIFSAGRISFMRTRFIRKRGPTSSAVRSPWGRSQTWLLYQVTHALRRWKNLRKSAQCHPQLQLLYHRRHEVQSDPDAALRHVAYLYVFLARMGCHITQVELIRLNDLGEISGEKSNTPGVKIDFVGTSGQHRRCIISPQISPTGASKKAPVSSASARSKGRGMPW